MVRRKSTKANRRSEFFVDGLVGIYLRVLVLHGVSKDGFRPWRQGLQTPLDLSRFSVFISPECLACFFLEVLGEASDRSAARLRFPLEQPPEIQGTPLSLPAVAGTSNVRPLLSRGYQPCFAQLSVVIAESRF